MKNLARLYLILTAVVAVIIVGLVDGCKTGKLEPGGAYAPAQTGTNSAPLPDYTFFVADSAYDLAYSAVNAAFEFERKNRAMLWSVSPNIKHELDKIRPQAVAANIEYAKARAAYVSCPTLGGLTPLQTALAKMQQLSTTAASVLPK